VISPGEMGMSFDSCGFPPDPKEWKVAVDNFRSGRGMENTETMGGFP